MMGSGAGGLDRRSLEGVVMTPGAAGFGLLAVRAGLPVASAVAGGVIGAAGTRGHSGAAAPLIYFAAGAFLGIALLHLMPEAAAQAGWGGALAAGVVGLIVTALLARW